MVDLARVTRNRRNTQVLRAEQKQLTLSVCKKQKNPPKSVLARPGDAGRACAAPGRRRVRGVRSASAGDHTIRPAERAPNPAGAASFVFGPVPPTGISGFRARPAWETLKTVGAEAAVRYEEN
jgi:hypothetical protein